MILTESCTLWKHFPVYILPGYCKHSHCRLTYYLVIVSIHIVDFSARVGILNVCCQFFHSLILHEDSMHYDDRAICKAQPC